MFAEVVFEAEDNNFPIRNDILEMYIDTVPGKSILIALPESDRLQEDAQIAVACALRLRMDGITVHAEGQLVLTAERYLLVLYNSLRDSDLALRAPSKFVAATMMRADTTWHVAQKNWRGKPTVITLSTSNGSGESVTIDAYSVVAVVRSDGSTRPANTDDLAYLLSDEGRSAFAGD